MVFKSRQPCADTLSLDLDPLLHSGVVSPPPKAGAAAAPKPVAAGAAAPNPNPVAAGAAAPNVLPPNGVAAGAACLPREREFFSDNLLVYHRNDSVDRPRAKGVVLTRYPRAFQDIAP